MRQTRTSSAQRQSTRRRRFAGPDAKDRVSGAPADETGGERDQADPASDRLIGRPEEAQSGSDERQPDDDAQDPIDGTDICTHDTFPVGVAQADLRGGGLQLGGRAGSQCL